MIFESECDGGGKRKILTDKGWCRFERASWRLDLLGRRREDGEGGQGSKEEALVEGHWPGNQDVWVEVLPALLIIVIVIITVKFY